MKIENLHCIYVVFYLYFVPLFSFVFSPLFYWLGLFHQDYLPCEQIFLLCLFFYLFNLLFKIKKKKTWIPNKVQEGVNCCAIYFPIIFHS